MEPWLAAHLPVLDLALDAVRAVQRAAARAVGGADAADPAPPDPARVATAFASDRVLALDGRPVQGFAELSGFFRAADGWVRTHANYPHHRSRLTALAGLPDGVDRAAFARRLAELPAQELEDRAAEAGAIVARVRTEQEWRASEPGRAAASGPLVRTRPGPGDADPSSGSGRRPSTGSAPRDGGAPVYAPLAGVRVLDLTRVIAGPVATRTLALLGADVLRVDPPDPAEIEWQHLDTGQGKRSAVLNLRDAADLRTAQVLLDAADVLVTGYRPGAIETLGLRPPDGVVTGRVSAWGDTGPWAGRRGFDSIVQAASGIALLEGRDGGPGALPAQALDHASGYLLAAGIVDALTLRREGHGGERDVSVSLARTATWLLDLPGRDPLHPPATAPRRPEPADEPTAGTVPHETVTHGRVTTARPALPGHADYPYPARPWGQDTPTWPPVPPK